MAKILVLEDDPQTLDNLREVLRSEKHAVDCVDNAGDALQLIKLYSYDALIFDWELPGMSGIELIKKYRELGGTAPVLMLTGRTATADKISGLDTGADYYLTKPLDGAALLGFVRASLRRAPTPGAAGAVTFLDLQLFVDRAEVRCGQQMVLLSAKELALVQFLFANSDRIVTYEQLQTAVWPDCADGEDVMNKMRVLLTQLRDKLQQLGSQIKITSVRGVGYRIS